MALKALVIDDSGVMRKMVMRSVTDTRLAEFEYIEAQDGLDGLAKLKENEIDIAFVDWNMPNMSGIEFVREVRKIERNDDLDRIPLVMVTSEKTIAKLQEALDEAGADQFISKPFTVEELERKLKGAVDRAKFVQIKRSRVSAPAAPAPKPSGFFSKMFS